MKHDTYTSVPLSTKPQNRGGGCCNLLKYNKLQALLTPLFLLFITTFVLSSCGKDAGDSMPATPPMFQMYTESKSLPEASIDSIKNFTGKFGYYVGIHPESHNDHYYDPIVDNLRYALSLYGYQLRELSASVTVNDEWAGQRYLYY